MFAAIFGGWEILLVLAVMFSAVLIPACVVVAIVYFIANRGKAKSSPTPTVPVPPVAAARVVPPQPIPVAKTEVMPQKCPQCGATLKPDAAEGLCPACLLQRGFATEGGPAVKPSAFEPPSFSELALLFPQLEIQEILGRGGMGAVYKARQPRLDRLVALKILAPEKQDDPQFAERFQREARALARLNHPNIVTIYDFGEVRGRFYLLMEFVDGLTLRQVLRNGKLSPAEALDIVPEICEALQYAHGQGIVHRDIKPENILMDKQGRVKIADFGIAKIAGLESQDFSLTGAKDVMGTPVYMAPEQVEKPQTVDHRADLYSLGVVFYEMLTGELPLGKFSPPSQKVSVDVRLDQVVLHALEKEPARRYQHASEVKSDVETVASHPPSAGAGATPLPFAVAAVSARNESDKAILPAFLLAFFFGVFGAHRFYAGKPGTALLQLCTCGGFGIWSTIDWILLVCKAFTDGQGRRMTNWTHSQVVTPSTNQRLPVDKKPSAPVAALGSVAPTNLSSAMITAPAIALLLAGGVKIAAIVFNGWLLFPGSPAILGRFMGAGGLAAPGYLPFFVVVALFEVIPGALMLFGGYQMLQWRNYTWAMVAGILGIFSCGFISVPVGIWTLVVLARDDVKAAFDSNTVMTAASGQPNHFWRYFMAALGSIFLVFLGVVLLMVLAFVLMPELRAAAGWRAPLWVGGKSFHASPLSAEQLQQAGIHQEDGEFRKESSQSFPLDADGTFSIFNVDGPVEIHGWDSNAVALKITIHGKTADAVDIVKINVDSQPQRAEVQTDLGDHMKNGWNWLRMIGLDKAKVDYVVQVPRRAQLAGVHSVDGRVAIEGVAGPITVTTVDGATDIQNAANNLELTAVDGKISVSMGSLGAGQSVSLHTVDGGITLAVPEDADASFSVHTIDGGVSSEFPELQPKQKPVVGHKLKGKLGNGRAEVTAETVDGAVKIVKRRAAKPASASARPPAPLFYEWHETGWVALSNHDFSVDSPVVSAGKRWLALVDAENYSESWKEAATFVQAKRTEADWTNLINTNRAPVGKLISRQLLASIPLTMTNGVPASPAISGPITASPPFAPDGPYVFMRFESSFADKKDAKEDVTLSLENDGQWRVVGYSIK